MSLAEDTSRPLHHRAWALGARAFRAGLAAMLISTLAVQGLSYLVQLILAPTLGPQNFGIVRASESLVSVVALLAAGGMPALMMRYIAEATDATSRQYIFRRVATVAVVGGFLATLILQLVAPFLTTAQAVPFVRVLALALVFTALGRTALCYFYGADDPKRAASVVIPVSVTTAAAVVLSVMFRGMIGWATARVLGEAFLALSIVWAAIRAIGKDDGSATPIADGRLTSAALAITGLPLAISLLLRTTSDNLPILAFARWGTPGPRLGVLGLCSLLATGLLVVPSGVITLSLPRMVSRASRPHDLWRFIRELVALSTVVTVVPAVIIMSALPTVTQFWFKQYADGIAVSAVILLTVPLRVATGLAGTALLAIDRVPLSFGLTALCLSISLTTQFIVVPRFGLSGVVIGTVASELFATVCFLGSVWWQLHRTRV